MGPASAVPEVTRLTVSPADTVAPPVLSVNPEASFGLMPTLDTAGNVLELSPLGAAMPSSYTLSVTVPEAGMSAGKAVE